MIKSTVIISLVVLVVVSVAAFFIAKNNKANKFIAKITNKFGIQL